MAKNPVNKRAERREKNERSMNRAVVLLIAGLAAEWYLLMADRFYVHGTVGQLLKWADLIGALRWIGLAVTVVGAAMLVARRQKPSLGIWGWILFGVGLFFAFSSFAMYYVYPMGATVLCVLVPVVLILGIIYLFYQAEFAVQSTALAMALGALVLLNRSSSAAVKCCAVLALAGVAALVALTLAIRKNGGVFTRGETHLRLFTPDASYRLTLGVPAICFVLVALALAVPTTAFYATWVLAIVTFVLAVYYTIKLM